VAIRYPRAPFLLPLQAAEAVVCLAVPRLKKFFAISIATTLSTATMSSTTATVVLAAAAALVVVACSGIATARHDSPTCSI
jgi:hypothetical protein